jgi:FtsP/CotA-like multicopper oxidase with cupredoxin domain
VRRDVRGVAAALLATACGAASDSSSPGTGIVRTYYIAVDEIPWNYAPSGKNLITGTPFGEDENVFVKRGSDRIGHVYVKALYREYTDASFTTLKPRPAEWAHLGVLGPVIQAEVGDTIRIVFKNNASRPYSLHPHGVFYKKDSEGAPYNDNEAGEAPDDSLQPGQRHTYTWAVPPRSGPGPEDGSSILWIYHSHANEVRDTNAGLVGPIIITREGMARPDGSPRDIDREFVTLFTVFDENQSWYLDKNVRRFAGDPTSVDPEDEDFIESNLMHSINGYVYGNLPLASLTMRKGERVRWYTMGMGTEVDLHTPHWHANTLLEDQERTDTIELLPASAKEGLMTPDNAGIWLYHCHVNDHITAGMAARYRVIAD